MRCMKSSGYCPLRQRAVGAEEERHSRRDEVAESCHRYHGKRT